MTFFAKVWCIRYLTHGNSNDERRHTHAVWCIRHLIHGDSNDERRHTHTCSVVHWTFDSW